MPDPRSILERASRLAADHPLPTDGFRRLVEFRERRRRAKRVSAAVFALVLVTVTFGWLAWSLTSGDRQRPAREFEGGSPSEVSTRSIAGTCLNAGPAEHGALAQEITLEARSHLLVSFIAEWSELDAGEEGHLAFEVAGPSGTDRSDAWTFGAEPDVSTSGNVMWSFEAIGSGTYRVSALARVRSSGASGSQAALSAGLENCALTVFVVPAL
jgi:hypothetical protein